MLVSAERLPSEYTFSSLGVNRKSSHPDESGAKFATGAPLGNRTTTELPVAAPAGPIAM